MKFETLKQSHLKRNIIIGVVAVLIISAIVLTFTRAKYKVTESILLVNGTINYSLADLNVVALYINGEETTELDSTKSYTLDTTQSTCTYKDGTTIDNLTLSYDSDTGELQISPFTTKGTKCTLYFDEYVPTASDTIEDLYPENDDMLAYDDYGNLRYIGADPNNYVLFNNELWRIIGIFSEDTHGVEGEKLIKIIRDESLGYIAWNSANTNDWSTASLQTTLNGDYLNGTGSYTSAGITDNSSRDMIETVTWKLGGTSNYTSSSNGLASHWYGYERGTNVYIGNSTWTGKVALMYPSDYGYATSGGATTDRETCLAVELYIWEYDCYNNDWLTNNGGLQWTLTQHSSNFNSVFVILDTGGLEVQLVRESGGLLLPSVYLKSNVTITSVTGSSSDPYILQLN